MSTWPGGFCWDIPAEGKDIGCSKRQSTSCYLTSRVPRCSWLGLPLEWGIVPAKCRIHVIIVLTDLYQDKSKYTITARWELSMMKKEFDIICELYTETGRHGDLPVRLVSPRTCKPYRRSHMSNIWRVQEVFPPIVS